MPWGGPSWWWRITSWWLGSIGGRYQVVREADQLQPIGRLIWDTGGTHVNLSGRGAGIQEPGLHQLAEISGYGTDDVPWYPFLRGGNMARRFPVAKYGRIFPANRPLGGPMEDGCCHSVPLPGDSHRISWCAPWILGWLRDKYRLPRGQADPKLGGNYLVGPIWDILVPVKGIWLHNRSIFLDILDGYGVRPRALWILWR